MEKKRLIIIITTTLVIGLLIIVIATLASQTTQKENYVSECPVDFGPRPLIVVSLDGFRPDYLRRGQTPVLKALADAGVQAQYMISTYPTVTFPNHYTMVTGLYPETHGIIENNFFDPEFQREFTLSGKEKDEGRWWGGEPIWNTLTKHGKKSASYFWPGSSAPIGGQHPTHWFKYDETVNFTARIDQVLEWISLPSEERPVWISLYFNQPDLVSHYEGPYSVDVDEQLRDVDYHIGLLQDGLREQGLLNCVNIMILSDHGMVPTNREQILGVKDFVPNIEEYATFRGDAVGKLTLLNKNRETETDIMQKLSCKRKEMRVFTPKRLPKRLHYANNKRIEDIIIDLDPGYMISLNGRDFDLQGNHGYDNLHIEMHALFLAYGPDFHRELVIEPFHNIELYNLMCHLTGVPPAGNNGTWGALHHLLVNPPAATNVQVPKQPPVLRYPENDLDTRLKASGCDGSTSNSEPWMPFLNITEEEEENIKAYHAPWGIPLTDNEALNISVLYHTDHITGYSSTVRMPMWTSFSIHPDQEDDFMKMQPDWSLASDARLEPESTPTCSNYDILKRLNFTMMPLFPHAYNSNVNRTSHLISNAIPVSQDIKHRWRGLMGTLVPAWLASQGPLNVILGPVFDHNSDSLPDDFAAFRNNPVVPTDLFAILTRCQTEITSLDLCPENMLDSSSFIFHQDQPISNCLDQEAFTLQYSSRVRDVELATSFSFFLNVPFEYRIAQVLRMQQPQLWPLENT